VSLGAILLSLYYILFWKNPHTRNLHLPLVRNSTITSVNGDNMKMTRTRTNKLQNAPKKVIPEKSFVAQKSPQELV
jgi:hypothetical protein